MAMPQSARRYDPAPAPFAPIEPTPSQAPDGSPFRFVIRCVIERKGNQWQAFSLELGLAVQADSKAEAKQKLESMIRSYIEDAICGPDQAHAFELLSRKATWRVYFLYQLASLSKFFSGPKGYATFSESLPLIPKHC